MTNKIKRLISILLVTVLFLLTIQPAFATGNKRKIDDYSIEELLNLSVQEQENLGFYVLAEVPMRVPVSNTDGSRVVSYIDGTWRVLYTKANGLGFYMSVSGTDYYTSYSDNIERSCPFSTTALVPEQSIYNTTYTYDFYDVGTYLDCSVGCYFGVVGSSKPIYWSATTQVTIPKL